MSKFQAAAWAAVFVALVALLMVVIALAFALRGDHQDDYATWALPKVASASADACGGPVRSTVPAYTSRGEVTDWKALCGDGKTRDFEIPKR